MVISVGYRVKSEKGIEFRIWANQVLKEYLLCSGEFATRSACSGGFAIRHQRVSGFAIL
jgi:hypothetical protein